MSVQGRAASRASVFCTGTGVKWTCGEWKRARAHATKFDPKGSGRGLLVYLKCVEDDVAAVGCCVLGSLSTDPMQERTMCPVRHTIRVPRWTRTPLTGRTVHDYISQNVKRSPLSSYHLKHSTIVEHSDASTCPCASIARASQWSPQCSLTSGLSGMYGWTRQLRTPTQRERRSFTLSVQSNARTRLPSNVSVVFQGQISSSSDAIS